MIRRYLQLRGSQFEGWGPDDVMSTAALFIDGIQVAQSCILEIEQGVCDVQLHMLEETREEAIHTQKELIAEGQAYMNRYNEELKRVMEQTDELEE